MTDDPSSERIVSPADRFNARLGMTLFTLYLAFYVVFVLVNAFQADWMDVVVVAGLNLAVVYGFALILVAIVLSIIYGLCCKLDSQGDEASSTTKLGAGDPS